MRIVLSTFAPLAVGGALNAEKVAATVKIIDRQTHGTVYTYFVPSYSTATAQTNVETAVLGHQDLAELIRLRPDIGLHIYRNLAVGMGEKLKRLDVSLADR